MVLACVLPLVSACGGRSHLTSGQDDCPADDSDGDCQASTDEGGSDCDDSDPSIFAGAPDNGPGPTLRGGAILDWSDLPFPFCTTMDRSGALHLLGGDGKGVYRTDRSGTWETVLLENAAPSGYCTLFVDGDGLHVISVKVSARTPTTYARHPGSSAPEAPFVHETVTSGSVVTSDLWRSTNGRTFVAYLGEQSGVVVTERTAEGWVEERIAALPGWGDLALSGSGEGEPWVLTNRLRDIYSEAFFSMRSGGVWTDQQLAEGATSHMALALARHHRGVPELAFQYSRHGNYGPPGRFSRVEYRALQSSGWESSVVVDPFWVDCIDIGVDRSALTRVALLGHADQSEGSVRELRVYEKHGSRWVPSLREELDRALPLSFCTLRLDAGGAVAVVIADESNRIRQLHNRSTPDGIDQNCDGVDGVDLDRDGIASFPTGGTDDDE